MNKEAQKPQVVFLSGTGFPDAHSAYNHKITLMSKALLEAGWHPTVLSKANTSKHAKRERGTIEGIDYLYLTDTHSRGSHFGKVISYLKGYLREIALLHRLSKRSLKTVLIMSYSPAWLVLYYRVLSKLLGSKLVVSIMEYHVATAKGLYARLNAVFFDHQSYRFCDGVLPISHFLDSLVKHHNTHKPSLVIPVLADYNYAGEGNLTAELDGKRYFLLCAGIGYRETIDFVAASYTRMKREDALLVLVLSGAAEKIDPFKQGISKDSGILVCTALPYVELYAMYKGALALLIPMRDHSQDQARFPQKIAEYLASGRPIVTTAVGEINRYFTNENNAFVVDSYDVGLFSNAMRTILDNPALADEVGESGRSFGLLNFHYQVYSDKLATFFESL